MHTQIIMTHKAQRSKLTLTRENFAGPTHSKSGWLSRRPPSKKKKKKRSRYAACVSKREHNENMCVSPIVLPTFP
jgi:hypothetical protein